MHPMLLMLCRLLICLHLLLPAVVFGAVQNAPEVPDETAEAKGEVSEGEEEVLLPSDAASLKIMVNYSTVTGAKARSNMSQLRATGTFVYGNESKPFELIETREGHRCLTLSYRLMGRLYRERIVSLPGEAPEERGRAWKEISKIVVAADGSESWESVFFEVIERGKVRYREQFGTTVRSHGRSLRPRPLSRDEQTVISGRYAELSIDHFQKVFLLLQPFLREEHRRFGFRYLGVEKLLKRPMYVIRRGDNQYHYFDQKKFLLVQWGGQSTLGGRPILVDYRSRAFKRFGGVLLPSKIALVADQAVLGSYQLDAVEWDAAIDRKRFAVPSY